MPQQLPQEPGITSLIGSETTQPQQSEIIKIPSELAAVRMQQEQLRYHSIGAMQRTQKINALKDLTVNPFELEDPYDGVNNALYRWKTIATSPEASKATPEQKQQVAANYYKSVIAPMYERMNQKYGSPIPPEKIWMDNAYEAGEKWNMDSQYDEHWQSGLYAGFQGFHNIMKTGLVILGGMVRFNMPSSIGKPDSNPTDQLFEKNHSAFENMEHYAKGAPVVGHLIDYINKAISKDSYWQDINPNTSWGQKARSWAAENAMMLPLYAATGGFTSGLIEGASGEAAVPLTQLLSQGERGKTALKLLVNGAEGAAYGYTMADDNAKTSGAVQGAITQAVLGTLFHFKGKKVTLGDVSSTERKAALEHESEVAAMAQKGWTHNDTEALGTAAAEAMRDSSLAGGRPRLMEVLNRAFGHVAETEGQSMTEVRKQAQELLDKDPAQWKHPMIVAGWLRSLLDKRKLTGLSQEEKNDLFNKVLDRIRTSDHLVQDAGSEEQIVKEAKTSVGQQVSKDVGAENYVKSNKKAGAKAVTENAKRPIDELLDIHNNREQVSSKNLPPNLKNSKPRYGYGRKLFELKFDDPRDLAAYVLSMASKTKSAAHAQFAEYYKNQFGNIIGLESHARKVRDFIKSIAKDADPEKGPIRIPSQVIEHPKDPGVLKVRTSYRGKGANRSVSVQMGKDWTVYAKKAAKAAGFGFDVKKWLDGLPPEKFVEDLHEFFYPESLRKAGLDTFESGNVKNVGAENPNFLAFMYNFRDRMPPEFRAKLRDELIATAKVQGELNPRALDEPQLIKYAQAMKAHVDELLAAEKHLDPNIKGEVGNVYRSTYQEGYRDDPTEYQMELHEEVIEHEREFLASMFKNKPQQLKEAMTAYNLLAGSRTDAFLTGEHAARIQKQSEIDDLLVKHSKGTLEKWEY